MKGGDYLTGNSNYTIPSLDLKSQLDKLFICFQLGRCFCYCTPGRTYFSVDISTDQTHLRIRYALNLSCAEVGYFWEETIIPAAHRDEEYLFREVIRQVLAYEDRQLPTIYVDDPSRPGN